jgi:hypothetical protein
MDEDEIWVVKIRVVVKMVPAKNASRFPDHLWLEFVGI